VVPPFVEYSIVTVVLVKYRLVHVTLYEEYAYHVTAVFGDVTVITRVGADIVKVALLTSVLHVLVVSVSLIKQVADGTFGTAHA
jgi:hypothetical protein